MKYLRKFDSVSDMQTAIANTEIDFIGLAYDNGEPKINIATVQSEPTYEYVKIGGLKWATKNVGARTETDAGLYFQWGDTNGYTSDQVSLGEKVFAEDFSDYKYYENGMFTKYNSTDSKTELDLEDDAAHVNIGGDWMMPTKDDWQSLINNTTSEWVTNYNGSGVNGRLFTDKTDSNKKLFFPASGYCCDGSVLDVDRYGDVWGCSLRSSDVSSAWSFNLYSGEAYVDHFDRCVGLVVRGVQVLNLN